MTGHADACHSFWWGHIAGLLAARYLANPVFDSMMLHDMETARPWTVSGIGTLYYTTGRAKGWHTVPDEILEWVTTALRESQADRKQFHDEAMANLQREHRRLQDRIDAMYLDKLDGRRLPGSWVRKRGGHFKELGRHLFRPRFRFTGELATTCSGDGIGRTASGTRIRLM